MPESRTQHPFAMYDGILQQPDRIARLLQIQSLQIASAAAVAAGKQRIIFAGIGSSFHAATLGEYFLRHLTNGLAVTALEQSFEMVHYPIALSSNDAVVLLSHRGVRNYSVEALARAKSAGAFTVAITGDTNGQGMRGADFVIPTCELETAFAHTKSYTSALAALALFAIHVADRRGQLEGKQATLDALASVPAAMQEAVNVEAQARDIASAIAKRERWIFTGAGPNWATAREGALKVKETSYIASEGFETEQFLHGPICELDSRAAMVTHLTGSPSDLRAGAMLRALGEIGVLRVIIATQGSGSAPDFPAEHRIEVPTLPEWLSPFAHVVPVQLLSYFVALARGTNPDAGRADSIAHARAFEKFKM
ncbi:MAG: SIS domain-containing protein [Acidobacteria bacterium]|nr:SIS domain-containing protein [Acidobacteriota bacterium]